MSFRLTGILILLLALVAGLVAYARFNQPEKAEDKRPQLWDIDQKKINRIEIRLPQEKKQIAFLLDKEADTWFFDDARKTPLDKKRWGGIVLLLSNPQGKRKIMDKADNLDNFGLQKPGTVINLGLEEINQPFEILIGDQTPQKDQYYVKLGHSDPVYLVNSTFVGVLNRLVKEPPVNPLTRARDRELGRDKSAPGPEEKH